MTPIQAITEFLRQIDADTSIGAERPILLAVSGGSDSVGMLHAFSTVLGEAAANRLVVVTIDHGLRAGSRHEAEQVAAICGKRGIFHEIRTWAGPKPLGGMQANARIARYDLLAAAAAKHNACLIAVAHTADDQNETIAMRARRSVADDARGLSGIASQSLIGGRHWVVRPFLTLPRARIRSWLRSENISWVEDPSNLDRAFERVRVRLDEPNSISSGRRKSEQKRLESNDAAAAFIQKNVTLDETGVVIIADPSQNPFAVGVLAALVGGRSYLPSAHKIADLSLFLEQSEVPAMTSQRVVLHKHRGRCLLTREIRNLPSLTLSARETAVWDHRFRVTNLSDGEIVVGPAEVGLQDLDPEHSLPRNVRRRALVCQPMAQSSAKVAISAYFAPFEQFLPEFDLKLARSCAQVLGRDHWPPPPPLAPVK